MKIQLNDEPRTVADGCNLHVFLTDCGFAAKAGIAVAVNHSIVPVGQWEGCDLSDGDSILLIQATQGG
ncbi:MULTISPECIES: sulfur carrier protein ThiS [unclassified Lentimonas]|uniref:sulfur carrier protein ThiS n=1 Tax=unclassified Lentimonas TaxID=2630993 RepID=UPI001326222F|nr:MULTISPECIES: sulfur carrier protein ThiS [unclassified Lentimonas]CAA6691433.1 Unannotated [Lentimonas sp. CC10]CAA6693171.1 Unannotated [Lentimonas sp. CC19]CAA7068947.1 Unannotated [Lentimonas sp. CC11]